MPLFGAGIQNQIYGYGLNPGLVPLSVLEGTAIACIPCITLSSKWALIDLDSKVPILKIEECDCG